MKSLFTLSSILVLSISAGAAPTGHERWAKQTKSFKQKEDQKIRKKKVTEYERTELKKIALLAVNDARVRDAVKFAHERKQSVKIDVGSNAFEVQEEHFGSSRLAKEPTVKNKKEEENKTEHIGVGLDVGVPYGIGLNAMYRPIDAIQFYLGGTYNLAAPGIRAGAAVDFFDYWVSPSVGIEAGHVFEADYNNLLAKFSTDTRSAFLNSIDYNYVTGLLTLEFGNRDGWRISVGTGVTIMDINVNDFEAALNETIREKGDRGVQVSAEDPSAMAILPTGKIGFKVFF